MNFLNMIKQDIKFQFRHGFYYVYVFICVFYISIIKLLPSEYTIKLVKFVLFTDTAILGYFFIAGLIYLEKDQNILQYFLVTPLKLKDYIISKIASLSIISLIMSFIIIIFTIGFKINFLIMAFAISMISSLYILIGVIFTAKSKSINGYIFNSIPILIIISIPLLSIIDLNLFLFKLIPTYNFLFLSDIALIKKSITENLVQIIIYTVYNIGFIYFAFKISIKRLRKEIISNI